MPCDRFWVPALRYATAGMTGFGILIGKTKGARHSAPFSFGSPRMGPRDKREDDGFGSKRMCASALPPSASRCFR